MRGNLWYDGRGRVWQRWNDNSSTEDWDATLKRFVYDGAALVQEHEFDVAELGGTWVYTYSDLTRDYLRHPAGVRQRQRSGGNDTDYYLEANSGALEFKTERDPVAEAIARTERTASLNQISGATFTPGLSNLATTNNYIETYGGSTSGAAAGFDALLHRGNRHFLTGLARFTTRRGNNTYELRGVEAPWPSARPARETSIPEKLTDLNEECGIKCLMSAADRVKNCGPLASAATGNLLHDFCCVPWICLAYYHILPEEEENDCFECLCLVGNPADEDTPRGCLCRSLGLLSLKDLGWEEYVKRALWARDQCKKRKPGGGKDCGPELFKEFELHVNLAAWFAECGTYPTSEGDVTPCPLLPDEFNVVLEDPAKIALICCNLDKLLDMENACEVLSQLISIIQEFVHELPEDWEAPKLFSDCCECVLGLALFYLDQECARRY